MAGTPLPPEIPFANLLGIRLVEHQQGRAVIELDMRDDLRNSWGVAHGGVVMTLADISLAIAARTMDPLVRGAMTVEMKTSFIGPGQGTLRAEGRCLKAGASLAFCEGEVTDERGELVAKSVGTFMLRKGRVAGDDGSYIPQGMG
jgi:uncharacterized protein (TIGR00369 family)